VNSHSILFLKYIANYSFSKSFKSIPLENYFIIPLELNLGHSRLNINPLESTLIFHAVREPETVAEKQGLPKRLETSNM